jgi:biotin carboxyl carrier protein
VSAWLALLDGGAREVALEVLPRGGSLYDIRVAGRTHLVDAAAPDAATLSLLVDGQAHAATLDARGGKLHVRVGGSGFALELLGERRQRLRGLDRPPVVAGRQVVRARVPGRVVRVLVKEGDAVRAGQPVAVVRALEMENEVPSPKDGRVVALRVHEGEEVQGNATLCAVE